MAKTESNRSVGLISERGAKSQAVRRILRECDLSIVFDILPDTAEDHQGTEVSSLVVALESLDDKESVSLLTAARGFFPDTCLIVCSSAIESFSFPRAIDLAVDGLVWHTDMEEALEPTIRAVHAGQVALPRDVLAKRRGLDLTNREKQTLSMVIMGLTNLEIAQKLYISESTVKSHLNTAYKKLGVHSRAEAQRLVTDPEQGLGTGILAITAPGLARGRPPKRADQEG